MKQKQRNKKKTLKWKPLALTIKYPSNESNLTPHITIFIYNEERQRKSHRVALWFHPMRWDDDGDQKTEEEYNYNWSDWLGVLERRFIVWVRWMTHHQYHHQQKQRDIIVKNQTTRERNDDDADDGNSTIRQFEKDTKKVSIKILCWLAKEMDSQMVNFIVWNKIYKLTKNEPPSSPNSNITLV